MLSIIIVNYNSTCALKDCLKSIVEKKPEQTFEIIIIDNGSKMTFGNVIKEFEKLLNIRLILNRKNLGYAKAVNQGIRIARGEYILIINPDILITNEAIEKMIDFLDKNEKIGVIAPQLLNFDNSIQYSCFRFPRFLTPFIRRSFLKNTSFGKREIQRYLMIDFDHRVIKEVDWVLGAAMMTKKSVIEKIGLLDERFFLYFEDVDLCRRIHCQGLKIIYFPESKFFHQYTRHSADKGWFSFLFNKYFWFHTISCIKYFQKWQKIKS
uniref:Glycosyltransferase family 2 protein n=1 Tax=candidate division WOR-3 bacterium TaxID=2052148 RepID=A0A7V1EIM9_UNCW3